MNKIKWLPRPRRRAQRGASGPIFAVLLLPMMLLVGLVVDGGRVLVVQRRAQATVDAAAVAAAMGVDEGNFKDTNDLQLDGTDTQRIADHYTHFNEGSSSGISSLRVTCAVNGPNNTHVDCRGSLNVPTIFMRLVGIPGVHLNVAASSELKVGITQEGQ
jgi:Flp pilus assembly protein TadG